MRQFLYKNIFCLLAVWLALGIVIEWHSGAPLIYSGAAAGAGCIALYLAGRLRAKGGWRKTVAGTVPLVEHLQMSGFALIFISIGMGATALRLPSITDDELRSHAWNYGVVKEVKDADGHTRMEVRLAATGSLFRQEKTVRNVNVYLTTDSVGMRPGDVMVWRNRLTPIAADGNRQGDVWPEILRSQGILYRQHLSPTEWQVIGHEESVAGAMADARSRQRCLLAHSRLDPQAAALTIALTTGEREYLSDTTMENMRLTGVSHILALSGLHVGILAWLLLMLLLPLHLLPGHSAHKTRWVMAVLMLWGYAVFTGLSAPVVRACVMATVLFLAIAAERPYRPGNALGLAAFVILLVDPLQLFQAGFQLSFLVTALILAVMFPSENRATHRKSRWLNLCRKLLLILIAMAGSWILTAFHFHSVAIGSLPWNMLMSVALPVYFIAALVYTFMLNVGCDPAWAAAIVDTLARCVLWCGNHPEASLPVWINALTAVALCAAAVSFIAWLYLRERKWLITSGAALTVAIAGVTLLPSGRPKDGFIVQNYAIRCPDNQYRSAIRVYTGGGDTLVLLPDDTTLMLNIHRQRLLVLNTPRVASDTVVDCQLLLVGRGHHGAPDLSRIHADTVLLLPTVSRYTADKWLKTPQSNTAQSFPPVLDLRDGSPYPSFKPSLTTPQRRN